MNGQWITIQIRRRRVVAVGQDADGNPTAVNPLRIEQVTANNRHTSGRGLANIHDRSATQGDREYARRPSQCHKPVDRHIRGEHAISVRAAFGCHMHVLWQCALHVR